MEHDIHGRFVTVHVNFGKEAVSPVHKLNVASAGSVFSATSDPVVSFDVCSRETQPSMAPQQRHAVSAESERAQARMREQLIHEMELAMRSLAHISPLAMERRAQRSQFERVVFERPPPMSEGQLREIQEKVAGLPNIFA